MEASSEALFALVAIEGIVVLFSLSVCCPSWTSVKQRCHSAKAYLKSFGRVQPEVESIVAQTRAEMAVKGLCAAIIVLACIATTDIATHNFAEPFQVEVLFVRFAWQALALVVLLALIGLHPGQTVMNACYGLLTMSLPCFIMAEFCPAPRVPVSVATMWLLRCSLLPLCNSVTVVLLCNAACHVWVVLAVTRALDLDIAMQFADKKGEAAIILRALEEQGRLDQMRHFLAGYLEASRIMDIGLSLSLGALAFWMRSSLVMNVMQFVQMTGLKTEGRACSSLLATMCDAHFFLDANFSLENDEPSLAAMLFHGTKNKGAPFLQYIATEEERLHFLSTVKQTNSLASLARVMHLSLRDGVGSILQVEMFHVKVPGVSSPRHLVGIREYGDTVPETRKQGSGGAMMRRPSSPSMPSLSESDGSSASDLEAAEDRTEGPLILFDAKTLEVYSASRRIANKMDFVMTEETTLLDYAAPSCRQDLANQLASEMRVVLNEGQSCREATVTFRLNRRKGSPKNWTLRLQDQAGQVIGTLEMLDKSDDKDSWRFMKAPSSQLPPLLERTTRTL